VVGVSLVGRARGGGPGHPAAPDLDCKAVPSRRFDVVGLAPHGLDRDCDGVGSEV
jgi:hypothetical protein